MTSLLVGDICSRNLDSVSPTTPVSEALGRMHRHRHSSLLVVLLGEAIGIVTERDLARHVTMIVGFPDLKVQDIMSCPLLSLQEDQPALDAFHLMRREQIRHLAVLDGGYAVCGLLSLSDLMYKFAPASIPVHSTVGELMAAPVFSTAPETPLRQALAEMAQRSLSCVVVSSHNRPLGVLSERDLPRLLSEAERLFDRPVATVMTPLLPTIPTQTSTRDALALMQQHGVRRLLVAAADGSIQGLVTQSVLGRAIPSEAP